MSYPITELDDSNIRVGYGDDMNVDPGDIGQYRFSGNQSDYFFATMELRVESDFELKIDPGDTIVDTGHGSSCRRSELLDDTLIMDTGQFPPPSQGSGSTVDKPAAIQPIVDHISSTLENIRAGTFHIALWEVS